MSDTYYFDCVCGSSEHTLRFILNEDEKEMYTSIFLNQYRNIFKRIWVALKYILGYKCRYGHWDNWILDINDVHKLKQMSETLIETKDTLSTDHKGNKNGR